MLDELFVGVVKWWKGLGVLGVSRMFVEGGRFVLVLVFVVC